MCLSIYENIVYISFEKKIYSNLSHQNAFAVELLDETCCNNKWDTYQLSDLKCTALIFICKIKKTKNVVINGSCLVIVWNTTRVIHLEITETQSTNDFLLAWRTFINKQGVRPSHAYSERGQTFVGAQKPLRDWIANWSESIFRDTMVSLSTTLEFSWDFNIPLASRMNGVVESLIRSCRKAFHCARDYHKRSYFYPEWETIISETNFLVNSRPMFPDSPHDLDEEPLTVNSLLYSHG